MFETHHQNTPINQRKRDSLRRQIPSRTSVREILVTPFFPRKLSKSNSQTAHFHLLFHTFLPAKANTPVFTSIRHFICWRLPQTGKSRLPASSPHHPGDVRRKSSVQRCPIKVCQPGERLTQPYEKRDRCNKSSYINKGRKSKKAHSETKIPLVLIESMTATNIEQIDLT